MPPRRPPLLPVRWHPLPGSRGRPRFCPEKRAPRRAAGGPSQAEASVEGRGFLLSLSSRQTEHAPAWDRGEAVLDGDLPVQDGALRMRGAGLGLQKKAPQTEIRSPGYSSISAMEQVERKLANAQAWGDGSMRLPRTADQFPAPTWKLAPFVIQFQAIQRPPLASVGVRHAQTCNQNTRTQKIKINICS